MEKKCVISKHLVRWSMSKTKAKGEGKAKSAKDAIRLRAHYVSKVIPALQKRFNYDNAMQVPKITKITLNMGVGEAADDKKIVKNAQDNLTQIAGQKAVVTNARKSIAGFK